MVHPHTELHTDRQPREIEVAGFVGAHFKATRLGGARVLRWHIAEIGLLRNDDGGTWDGLVFTIDDHSSNCRSSGKP